MSFLSVVGVIALCVLGVYVAMNIFALFLGYIITVPRNEYKGIMRLFK